VRKVTGEKGHRFRERYKKESLKRWFWKGVWIIPFSLGFSILSYILALSLYGASSVLLARSRFMVGATVVISAIILVVGLIGSGWAQEEADRRVEG
jgi:hypothetical protein